MQRTSIQRIGVRQLRGFVNSLVNRSLIPATSGPSSPCSSSVKPGFGVGAAVLLAICAGDNWIDKGANLILIGGPGGGKTHLASASRRGSSRLLKFIVCRGLS